MASKKTIQNRVFDAACLSVSGNEDLSGKIMERLVSVNGDNIEYIWSHFEYYKEMVKDSNYLLDRVKELDEISIKHLKYR